MQKKITTFLTYDGQAEEAMNLYTSVIPNSRITRTTGGRPRRGGLTDDRDVRTRRPGVHGAERRLVLHFGQGFRSS